MGTILQHTAKLRFGILCSRKYSSAITGRKKFYKAVTITHDTDGYDVNLDSRKLKSPSGLVVKLPTESLANAVALEWDSQQDSLKFHTMPMTNLAFYAVDKPNGDQKSSLVDICMNFLETDTILFHSDEPPGLADYQLQEWGPIINWVKKRYQVELNYTKSFIPPHMPQDTIDVFEKLLMSYDFWSVTGFERLIHTLKSLILSVALVDRHLTVEEVVSLSRLEQEYQISKWGNVEWYHDVDLLESRTKVAASAMFIHSCSEDSQYIVKRNAG